MIWKLHSFAVTSNIKTALHFNSTVYYFLLFSTFWSESLRPLVICFSLAVFSIIITNYMIGIVILVKFELKRPMIHVIQYYLRKLLRTCASALLLYKDIHIVNVTNLPISPRILKKLPFYLVRFFCFTFSQNLYIICRFKWDFNPRISIGSPLRVCACIVRKKLILKFTNDTLN